MQELLPVPLTQALVLEPTGASHWSTGAASVAFWGLESSHFRDYH